MRRVGRWLVAAVAVVTATGALVAVTPGVAGAAVSLTASPTVGLRDGAAVSVTGSAPAGTSVYLVQCRNRTPIEVADCDTTSVRTLSADAAGRFSGAFTVRDSVVGTDCAAVARSCALVAARVDDLSDNAVVGLRFAPARRGSMVGLVHDDAGTPVPDAWVQVCPLASWQCVFTSSGPDGRYATGAVRPGVVRISVGPPDGALLLATAMLGEDPLALVRPGAPTTYDVELPRGGVVAGSFEEWDAAAVEVGYGNLCRADYCPSYVSPDGDIGRFVSGVTPTGTYRLSLYDTQDNLSELDGVVVTEGATTTVRLRRERRGSIAGRVTFYDGSPAADAAVSLCLDDAGADCNLRLARTDEDGGYRFTRLQPGTYAVEVDPGVGAPARRQRFGGIDVPGTDEVARDLRLDRATLLRVDVPGAYDWRTVVVCPVLGGQDCVNAGNYEGGESVTVGGLLPGDYDVQATAVRDSGRGLPTMFAGSRVGLRVGTEDVRIAIEVRSDGDGDSAPDADEAEGAGNGNGDGNGDGIPDAEQEGVWTVPAAVGRGTFTVEGVIPMQAMALGATAAAVPARVRNLALDQGSLAVHIVPYEGHFRMRLRMPAAADALLWRNPAGAWKRLDWDGQTGANVADAWVDLRLTDGGRGDSDGVANGRIDLQVAPGRFSGPAATIVSGPAGRTGATGATFEIAAPTGAQLQCSWDFGEFEPCGRISSRSGLAAGWHTFAVISSGAGSDGLGDYRVWLVGDTPTTRITSGPAGAGFGRSATFAIAASAGERSWCVLDLQFASKVDCSSGFTARNLAIGPHFLVVATTDASGAVVGFDVRQWTVNRSEDLARYRASRAAHRPGRR